MMMNLIIFSVNAIKTIKEGIAQSNQVALMDALAMESVHQDLAAAVILALVMKIVLRNLLDVEKIIAHNQNWEDFA